MESVVKESEEFIGSNKGSNPKSRFMNLEGGLFYISEKKDDDDNSNGQKYIRVSAPIEVYADTRDPDSESWGRLLKWKDMDGVEHSWTCPNELIEIDPREIRRKLVSGGLFISADQRAAGLLMTYLKIEPAKKKLRVVNKLGWHKDTFVRPDRNFKPKDDEEVIFNNKYNIQLDYQARGNLSKWSRTVGRLSNKNRLLMFVISSAAAAPLLEMIGMEGGGFHVRGSSGTGKTTLLKVAASFWGSPDQFVRTWRTTSNALEGTAAMHNDSILLLDELSQVSADQLAESAYMLSNGQGKGRATKDGLLRKSLKWRLLFLSSGEVSLTNMLDEIRKRTNPGQEIRMADISVMSEKNNGVFENLNGCKNYAELAEKLSELSNQYYGSAGVEWLEILVKNKSAISSEIKGRLEQFIELANVEDAPSQIRRVARRFGLVAAAGELLIEHKITPWAKRSAKNAAIYCFEKWKEGFGEKNKEEENILQQIRHFFEKNGASCFDLRMDPESWKIPNRAGFIDEKEDGSKKYMVFPNVFKKEVAKGLDYQYTLKILLEKGWLDTGGQKGRYTKKVRIPRVGTSNFYVFNSSIWEE